MKMFLTIIAFTIAQPLVAGTPAPVAALPSATVPAATVPATTAPATTVPAGITIDSPIADLMASAPGKAVLDANFPMMAAHPAYEQFKAMTLKQLQPLSQGMITDEAIAKTAAALAAAK